MIKNRFLLFARSYKLSNVKEKMNEFNIIKKNYFTRIECSVLNEFKDYYINNII